MYLITVFVWALFRFNAAFIPPLFGWFSSDQVHQRQVLERDAYVEYASGKMAICQMKLHKQCSAVNAKVWIAFVLSDSVFYKLLGGEGFECTHRAKVVFYLFHLFNLIEIIKFKPFKTVCLLRHFESLLQKFCWPHTCAGSCRSR